MQEKLIVDAFEINDQIITLIYCDLEAESRGYDEKLFLLFDLENWLNDEGYLKGYYEKNNPHPNGSYTTTEWNYTIIEFLQGILHNWNVNELLTKFLIADENARRFKENKKQSEVSA